MAKKTMEAPTMEAPQLPQVPTKISQQNIAPSFDPKRKVFKNVKQENNTWKTVEVELGSLDFSECTQIQYVPFDRNSFYDNAEGVWKKNGAQPLQSLQLGELKRLVLAAFPERNREGQPIINIEKNLDAFLVYNLLTLDAFKRLFRAKLPKLDQFDTDADYEKHVKHEYERRFSLTIGNFSIKRENIVFYPAPNPESYSGEKLADYLPEYLKNIL